MEAHADAPPEVIAQLIAEALNHLIVVNDLASSVYAIHLEPSPPTQSPKETFLVAYRLRMLRQSQAIVMLASDGLVDPASTILRVLLEQCFVLCAIAEDSTRLDDLFDQEAAEGVKALKGLRDKLDATDRPAELTNERLTHDIAGLLGGTGYSAHNWAGLAKQVPPYTTLYRSISAFSHGGAGAALKYLVEDEAQGMRLVRNVRPHGLPDVLTITSAIVLDSLVALPLPGMLDKRELHSELEDQLHQLYARTTALSLEGEAWDPPNKDETPMTLDPSTHAVARNSSKFCSNQ